MSSQALASLTATYTDSEGEETNDEIIIKGKGSINSPGKINSETNSTANSPLLRIPKLVSYNDDLVDDEGNVEEHIIETDSKQPSPEPEPITDDGIQLPPEPKGKCSEKIQEKFTRLYEKMQTTGLDMNNHIQNRKDFRNPSIYEKLIHYCDINELGTNYPIEIYDPLRWGKESYYEELAKVQKADMERREKERKEKTKVEFVSGTAKKQAADEDIKKRKSKWDQPATNAVGKQNIQPAGLVQPTLTASITGTKGTVISAFGSLPKKPRI